MSYSLENIETAGRVFAALFPTQQLPDRLELFSQYQEPEVREIVRTLARQWDLLLLEGNEAGRKVVYLIPEMSNTVFGHKNERVRRELAGSNGTDNVDLYLGRFIILVIMAMIYGGSGHDAKITDLVVVDKVIDRVGELLTEPRDDRRAHLQEQNFNVEEVAERWQELIRMDPGPQETAAQKSQLGRVLRACSLLEEAGYIRWGNPNRDFGPTEKFDTVMKHYYFTADQRPVILQVLEGGRADG